MSLDDFDEWDTTFLENFIEQEERIIAVSSINPTQSHNYKQQHQQKQPVVILDAESPPPPSMPSSQLPFAASHFSPPRELSQRFTDCRDYEHSSNGNAINALGLVPSFRHGRKEKDSETDNLKTELRRIRKQLTQLEQECVVLKKERDNKEAQLSSAFSQIDAKDVEINLLKRKNVGYESLIQDQSQNLPEHHAHVEQAALSNDGVALETCKAIGVQTEASRDFSHSTIKNNSPLDHDLSKKLLAIWGSPSGQRLEKNLVSRLFATCASDFWILFGCMSMNKPSTVILEASPRKSFYDMTLHDNKQAVHSVDAAKVSRLYTMLTKISNNMVQLDAFLGALLDLCILENVVVAHRSLCILRMILLQLPTYEGSSKRDNIMVNKIESTSNVLEVQKSECGQSGFQFDVSGVVTSSSCAMPIDTGNLCKNGHGNTSSITSFSCLDWLQLYEIMHGIVSRNREECIKVEAISIMNLILLRSNPLRGREKFGSTMVFESVSRLLRKEAGLCVQREAVNLLFLLLNCPKLLMMFCGDCKDGEDSDGGAADGMKYASAFPRFNSILEGLAECITCTGNGKQELKLCRRAIIVLAFVASSGKSGFKALFSEKLFRSTNYLEIIVRVLASQMDAEVGQLGESPEICKERTLLMREALIFLNRLVSNPLYSTAVLEVLTSSRDMMSLTIDIANRMSRKWSCRKSDSTQMIQMRGSEIIDLARVFKTRVFTYLGDIIS